MMDIWTRANNEQAWICVAEGLSEAEAAESVKDKKAAAEKYIPEMQVVALPEGRTPSVYTIRVIGNPGAGVTFEDPRYLEQGDVDAHEGRGDALLTGNIDRALEFDTAEKAFAYWKRIPVARPFRPDGEPNRPLTAFTVEIGMKSLFEGRFDG